MPQIEQLAATYASQLFWLLITFGILYFGIARTMLPKVGKVVEDREAKIAGDLDAARAAQTRASEAQAARDQSLAAARAKAQELIGQVKGQTGKETEARLKTLDAELEARTAEAERRVQASREAALGDLDNIAAQAASDIVARLTGTAPAPEAAAQAVGSARVAAE